MYKYIYMYIYIYILAGDSTDTGLHGVESQTQGGMQAYLPLQRRWLLWVLRAPNIGGHRQLFCRLALSLTRKDLLPHGRSLGRSGAMILGALSAPRSTGTLLAGDSTEIYSLLSNNQRQHRTLHIEKAVLPYAESPRWGFLASRAQHGEAWRDETRSVVGPEVDGNLFQG